MNIKICIDAFVKLGRALIIASQENKKEETSAKPVKILVQAAKKASQFNHWFIESNVKKSYAGIAKWLQKETIENWLEKNSSENFWVNKPKNIGVIMAGNIPLVGFHDFLCVLISGNRFVGKTSSRDSFLFAEMLKALQIIEPQIADYVHIEEEFLKDFDAIIATGSNNSARYFEHYFNKVPNIIRRNRNSVGVISADASITDFKALADDIFMYFGLGCRSISKIYLHKSIQISDILPSFEHYSSVNLHNKYSNNYDYNRAIFLMNKVQFFDNGFLLLRNASEIASPVSVLHYQYYSDENLLRNNLSQNTHQIQCIVSDINIWQNEIAFGNAQMPKIDDYADGIDTLKFLAEVSKK